MNPFQSEITEQPNALRQFVDAYSRSVMMKTLVEVPRPSRVVLSGMGASFHAALWASYLLQSSGIHASAVEATDLLYYSRSLLNDVDQLIFISQSGASAEVVPALENLPSTVHVVGLTNHADSPLGHRAQALLPLVAGTETTVAAKTYLNSLACLWLLAAQWTDTGVDRACQALLDVANRVEELLAASDAISGVWVERLAGCQPLFFLGHGPHVATARQGAMMLAEWAKRPAVGTSIGAFRHGLIEIAAAGSGVVVFGAGGSSGASVAGVADELTAYGAVVLPVVEGKSASLTGLGAIQRECDEFLSPLLDVIPAQVFAEALARHHGVTPGFRHIRKVIERL